VILLTKVMAVELAPLGVRVNAVSPGPVDPIRVAKRIRRPRGRPITIEFPPSDTASARRSPPPRSFLASPESSFVNGHVLNVDGGFNAAGLIFDDDGQPPSHCSADPARREKDASASAGNGDAVSAQGRTT